MGKATDKIPKMSLKELRSLNRKVSKLQRKAWDFEGKKRREMWAAYTSRQKIGKIVSRINYWIGKRKALGCPAYKKHRFSAGCTCHVLSPNGSWWSYNTLFLNHCADCKLTKQKALRQATFNSVFMKKIP